MHGANLSSFCAASRVDIGVLALTICHLATVPSRPATDFRSPQHIVCSSPLYIGVRYAVWFGQKSWRFRFDGRNLRNFRIRPNPPFTLYKVFFVRLTHDIWFLPVAVLKRLSYILQRCTWADTISSISRRVKAG